MGIAWLFLWFITMITNRKWQPLSSFLTANGWRKVGQGVYEQSAISEKRRFTLVLNDAIEILARRRGVV